MSSERSAHKEHEEYLARKRAQIEFESLHKPVDDETFMAVFRELIETVEKEQIPYALIGGLASSIWGRPRWTHDVDLLVQPTDASRVLKVLEEAGFETHRTDESWLYKAIKSGVLVDVMFKVIGDIYLDEDMIERTRYAEINELKVKVISPEDLLIIKVSAFDEQTPRHWFDALGIVARSDLDWDYLVKRGARAGRRLLSLLLFAQSNDVVVPEEVIDSLFRSLRVPES